MMPRQEPRRYCGKPSSAARPGGTDGYVDRDIAARRPYRRPGLPPAMSRVADDRERTLYPELHVPRVVAKTTFQMPS